MARVPSKAAYYLVDLSELPLDIKREIILGAEAGGGDYGVRVVEEIHNGPARQNLYGVYYGPDDELWQKAKADFGIASEQVADEAVSGEAPVDPAKEAALRQAAEEAATAEADRIRTAEATEIAAVTGDEVDTTTAASTNKANKAK